MSTFADALTRKIGPLPAWAYGVGLGLGISAFRYVRSRNAAEPTATEEQVASDGATSDPNAAGSAAAPGAYSAGVVGAYPVPGAYQMNPGGVITSSTPDQGTPSATVADNLSWQQDAYDALVGRQGYNALAVSEALKKYLAGEPITAQEEAIVSAALRAAGNPPDGAPSITRATTFSGTAPTPSDAPAPITSTGSWKPSWLGSAKFVIADTGGAVYLVTDSGLEWIPGEDAFYRLGGGGTVQLASGPYKYRQDGTPPLPVPAATLARLPKVGQAPPA